MIRAIIGFAILFSAPILAQAAVCSRTNLQSIADSYLSAQKDGDPVKMPLAKNTRYYENFRVIPIDKSLVNAVLPIIFSRSFIDTDICSVYIEAVVTDIEHPYVLGIRIKIDDGLISEINSIVTDEGDWKFNADLFLKHTSEEDWNILQRDRRITKQQLINAANAFFDNFSLTSIKVPWGIPCARLEGGDYTGDGPRSTCKSGIPAEPVDIVDRSYLVDIEMGVVNVFSRFGKTTADSRFGETPGLPDSHLIRVVDGKIRYIHSITAVDNEVGLK